MKIEKEFTLKVIIDYNQLGWQEVNKVYVMEDDMEIAEISRFLPPTITYKLLDEFERNFKNTKKSNERIRKRIIRK